MRIKLMSFNQPNKYVPMSNIVLGIMDDEDNPIVNFEALYLAKGSSFIITDYLHRQLYFDSVIDWNNISEEVENKLIEFDLKYNIDIK